MSLAEPGAGRLPWPSREAESEERPLLGYDIDAGVGPGELPGSGAPCPGPGVPGGLSPADRGSGRPPRHPWRHPADPGPWRPSTDLTLFTQSSDLMGEGDDRAVSTRCP
jgi:hypothetical protein